MASPSNKNNNIELSKITEDFFDESITLKVSIQKSNTQVPKTLLSQARRGTADVSRSGKQSVTFESHDLSAEYSDMFGLHRERSKSMNNAAKHQIDRR